MIGETFKKRLIEEGIDPYKVLSFVSKYDRKTDTIITVVKLENNKEHTIINETAWYASRKNKKW